MKLFFSCGFIWEKCEETAAEFVPLCHLSEENRCGQKNLLRLATVSHVHFFQSMYPRVITNHILHQV